MKQCYKSIYKGGLRGRFEIRGRKLFTQGQSLTGYTWLSYFEWPRFRSKACQIVRQYLIRGDDGS